ncbi:DUF3301 domain-containing protein [Allohahella marinimesophila]|uniref:DUF3301 domain-containing protein n=1 Tax=Allohahella marinimesophila TaxID=1054972 RepID=A0ABP7PXS7_9GAMM
MTLALIDIFWITLTLSAVGIWWQGLRIRERALALVRQRCEQLDLQLLDQSIAFRSIKLRRHGSLGFGLQRVYGFEFSSTGLERYRGEITMVGLRQADIRMDAHRVS